MFEEIWHPACFACHECGVRFGDFGYYVRTVNVRVVVNGEAARELARECVVDGLNERLNLEDEREAVRAAGGAVIERRCNRGRKRCGMRAHKKNMTRAKEAASAMTLSCLPKGALSYGSSCAG